MKLAPRVIIIGGGLAGLACAVRLQEAEIPFLLLEASKSLGGRVQTDHFEEYLLNRGFQVLLTSYPEAQRLLDFTQLKLHPFHAGALVRWQGKFYKISDLFRHPLDVFTSLVTPIGTFSDKMNLARLKEKMLHTSPQDLALHPETTTLEFPPTVVSSNLAPGSYRLQLELYEDIPRMVMGGTVIPHGVIFSIPTQTIVVE